MPASPGSVSPAEGPPVGMPFHRRLVAPVDAAGAAFLRIAVGFTIVVECVRFFSYGWIDEYFVRPTFRFTYFGFDWLRPVPGLGMHLVFLAIAVCAAAVAIGYRYRLATLLLTLGWTYVNLLDQSTYLNHAYLLSLICFLMTVLPAPRPWSLDARRDPRLRDDTIPAWSLWLLRFQIAVPYVFGGLAKFDPDWLHGLPLAVWLPRMTHLRERVPFLGEPWLALTVSYAGLLFDLAVVPLLLCRRTRTAAFAAALVFHCLNAVLFHIGVFPWLMILATTIFFDPGWPRRVLRWACGVSPADAAISFALDDGSPTKPHQRGIMLAMAVWIVLQIAIPFRHLLYPGDVDWTEEGSKFAWRMMLRDKVAAVRITATNLTDGRTLAINPLQRLTPKQFERMSTNPELLAQFCRHVGDRLRQAGDPDAEVHVLALCSLNFRKPQPLIDPTADLSRTPRSIRPQPWIRPLTEPRRSEPWLVPMTEWERHVSPSPIRAK